MKTFIYRLLGIGMLLSLGGQAIGQASLKYGLTPNNPVVSPPFLYLDLLCTTSAGWVWQYRTTPPLRWNNYEKVVNTKSADGDLTEVKTLHWSTNTQTWQTVYNNLYTYQKDANNNVLQVTWEQTIPNYVGAVQFDNTYNAQGRLEESIVSFRNGGVYVPTTHIYMKHDAVGNRVLDSGVNIPTSTNNLMIYYEYDNNNRCVRQMETILSANNVFDTTTTTSYTYTVDGRLNAKLIEYKKSSDRRIDASLYTYTYTPTGKIDEMTTYLKDTSSTQMDNDMFYKHYYNAQNKLAAMVFKQPTLKGWGTQDSIVMNYLPNGEYDTAHFYGGDGDMAWESSYSQRFLFDKNTTGIPQVNNITTHLTAYPNPATNTLFVEVEASTNGTTELVLTDMTGRVLNTQTLTLFAGQPINTQIKLNGMATGFYMLRAGNKTIKIAKQ